MDRTEVVAKMADVFAKVFGRAIPLEDSLTAPQVRGWDSLTNIRLLDAVERAFSISLSVTEAMSLDSVGSLVNVVHAKLAR